MQNLFKGILFLSAVSTLLFACTSKPSASTEGTQILPNLVDYYVRYLQEEQILKGEATFRLAEKPTAKAGVEVVGDVFFNNNKINATPVPGLGMVYLFKQKSTYNDTQSFDIQYSNGTKLKHSLTVPAMDSFWVEPVISLKDGFHLAWNGKPLDKSETLVLLLTDSKGITRSMNRIGGSTKPRFKIYPPQLEKVATGKGSLSLVRKNNLVIKEEDKKIGNFLLEYYSGTIEVEVEE